MRTRPRIDEVEKIMRGASAAPVRVGGQALPDGVLMRSPRAWAVARADGSVEVGPVSPGRFARVPVLRVVAALLPALGLGVRAMAGRPRKGAVVLGLLVAATFLGPALPSTPSPALSLGLAALTIAALRLAAPRALWRYHGAEHKAVAAFETGAAPSDLAAALAAPRVHARCGTNLVALVAVPAAFVGHLPALWQGVIVLATIGAAAEVLTLTTRRPTSYLARLVLLPGVLIQRHATTAEPTALEQTVACRALAACLDEHARLSLVDDEDVADRTDQVVVAAA